MGCAAPPPPGADSPAGLQDRPPRDAITSSAAVGRLHGAVYRPYPRWRGDRRGATPHILGDAGCSGRPRLDDLPSRRVRTTPRALRLGCDVDTIAGAAAQDVVALHPPSHPAHPAKPGGASPITIILGMHRPGTSLVAHLLSQAGYFPGPVDDLMLGDEWNRDGYFERWSIMDTNDGLLAAAGGAWDDPLAAEAIESLHPDDRMLGLLSAYAASARPLMKGPRLCLTLPVWLRTVECWRRASHQVALAH